MSIWTSTQQENTEQQSAWHLRRARGIGGSEIGIILGKSPYRTPYSLWLEKTGRKQPDNISALPHVQRGIQGEKSARILLEQKYLCNFDAKEWTKGSVCRCTDDGYSLDRNWILEIKCMGKDAHEAASRGEIPEHYRLQCQWNLMVSKAERCLFVSYRPEDQTMHEIVVLPDEKEGSELQHAAELWWSNHIVNNIPPPLMDGDYVACDLESWKEAANEYRAALQSAKDAEDRLEVAKTRLHSFVTKDIPALKGSGVMVSTVHRKGNIDYEKVPEIKGVDLEQYRKKPSTYITIKTY